MKPITSYCHQLELQLINFNNFSPLSAMFGSLFHLGIDALIVSAFLAAVKRSTGLTYVIEAVFFHGTTSNKISMYFLFLDLRYPKSLTRTFGVCLITPYIQLIVF